MKYTEVFEYALKGRGIRRVNSPKWAYLSDDGLLTTKDGQRFHYGIKDMRRDDWEVEPEKPEDIVVWGVCDDDGASYICLVKKESWENKQDGYCIRYDVDNFFPKDKPQKFKLTSVDD